MSPSSEKVRDLLDRFRSEAPEAASSLARNTVRGALEGLSGERDAGDWLTSPGGLVTVGGGLGLFAAGFIAGRRLHLDRGGVLRTGAAVAAGVAVGWFVGSRMAVRAEQRELDGWTG